jgi:hypothetical protein
MGRFAFIGDEYLNTDHILSITIQESDNTMYNRAGNGRTITRPHEYQLDILAIWILSVSFRERVFCRNSQRQQRREQNSCAPSCRYREWRAEAA